jgi:hypothetical protein
LIRSMHSVTQAAGSALTPWLVRVDGDNSLLAKSLKILSQWRGFQTFSEGKNTFDSGRLLVPVHCTIKGPRESGRKRQREGGIFTGRERERGRGREGGRERKTVRQEVRTHLPSHSSRASTTPTLWYSRR